MSFIAQALTRFLPLATLALASYSHADLTANIGGTSEYVRDGISETRGKPAWQAGLSFQDTSGLYAGVWSSGVERKEDSATFEHDVYAGYNLKVIDGVLLDMSVTRYTWAGDASINDQAYTGGTLRLLLNDAFTLGMRQTGNYKGSHFDFRTLEMAYTWQFSDFSLELYGAQNRWLEVDDEDYNFDQDTLRDSYWHFRVALDRSYGPWDFRLAVNRTNLSSEYDAGTTIEFGIQRYFHLW
ncbi:TorF family putative porin [Thalassolituus sp. LLYu03]|uniref:TorF family putative porin n=1 Tax=Thalassolituus sp. LLYu03 TaxID=3421656 RepID=UPI003D2E739C